MKLSPSSKERQWAMACHLSAFLGIIGIPMGTVIGPLCVWLLKRKHHPFVDLVGKEAVNFQISMGLYLIASIPLIWLGGIGIFLIFGLAALNVFFIILATIRAGQGTNFHYPLTLRIIR